MKSKPWRSMKLYAIISLMALAVVVGIAQSIENGDPCGYGVMSLVATGLVMALSLTAMISKFTS